MPVQMHGSERDWFVGHCAVAGCQLADDLHVRIPMTLWNRGHRGLSYDLATRPSEGSLSAWVPGGNYTIRIHLHHCIEGDFQDRGHSIQAVLRGCHRK